ncbi:predicted protein [Plenodomus lingam JN3]|uniref:Predicted protein n=1 Tax=Leptosphaeria maculans (strain JN3 / isolate v23.1.3 / race Av1-4-5-6-7-8) TaxID=985895 RepID=E5A8P5_LEPMJ|nr:predicted protein [Plenodomus lingam JN3]CBX99990.1 predicted protein [Plenodomus lingam JN3]
MWDRRLRTREPITVVSHRDHGTLGQAPRPVTLTVDVIAHPSTPSISLPQIHTSPLHALFANEEVC